MSRRAIGQYNLVAAVRGSIGLLASLLGIEEHDIPGDLLGPSQLRRADRQPECPLELPPLRRDPRLSVPIRLMLIEHENIIDLELSPQVGQLAIQNVVKGRHP